MTMVTVSTRQHPCMLWLVVQTERDNTHRNRNSVLVLAFYLIPRLKFKKCEEREETLNLGAQQMRCTYKAQQVLNRLGITIIIWTGCGLKSADPSSNTKNQ